jgi:shikimate kinase
MQQIVLIGSRGTGKTTIAQQLALALGYDWVDADVEIELRAGKSIAAIFADGGEPVFRNHESIVLAELLKRDRVILALGGGVVVRPENRSLLQTVRPVIWLTGKPETLWPRIQGDSTTAARRPALTVHHGIEEIRQLLQVREPWYRECAETQIATDEKSPGTIVGEIVEYLRAKQLLQ